MNVRPIDISKLSDEDAHVLHDFLLLDEAETEKYKKIKLFEPGDEHPYELQTISFQGSKIFVRTKEGKGSTKYSYTVYASKHDIGEGSYAIVYSASGKLEHIDGKMVYTKEKCEVIKKQTDEHETAKKECKMAQKLPDTKTKKMTSVYRQHVKCFSFNVMANIPDTDFSDTIGKEGRYTILETLQLMVSAWTDLKKIDDAGIIQRDIKPRNMRVDHTTFSIRILDFGLAREKEIPDGKRCGTLHWKSPEMIADCKKAGASSDVYSMGIVSRAFCKDEAVLLDHEMKAALFKEKRIKQYNNNEIHHVFLKRTFREQWQRECPSVDMQVLEGILQGATTSRPEHRSTIDEVLSVLNSLLQQVKMCIALENDDALSIVALLQAGVKPDYVALSTAIDRRRFKSVLAFVNTAQEDSNNINCMRAYGGAFLMAVRYEQQELITALLQKKIQGTNYFSRGSHVGWTALHFAIAQGNNELIPMILNHSMNIKPDYKVIGGPTPLQLAFEKKNHVAIILLLQYGAKPDYAALTKAADNGEWECVLAFVKANKEVVSQSAACEKAYKKVLYQAECNEQSDLIAALKSKISLINFDIPKDTYANCGDLLFSSVSVQPKIGNILEERAKMKTPIFPTQL